MSQPQQSKKETDNPQSQYLKVRPSTPRYHQLFSLAHEFGCSWQDVARYAIDLYLEQNIQKKSSQTE